MSSNVMFTGIIPALVSPLQDDGTVKEAVLQDLIRWQLSAGVAGFYLCGSTGEGVVMQPSARKRMAEITRDVVGDNGCVIDHIGAVDLTTALDLARHASDAGVDALSSIPPMYYTYGEEEIYQYYKVLAGETHLPFLIYTFGMSVSLVERLMEIPHIIGLKYTNADYYEMHRIKQLRDGDINVINGRDETLLCGLTMGADGGIGSTYNVMPSLYVELHTLFQQGELAKARCVQYRINAVIEVLIEFGVFPAIKELLTMMGYPVGYCTFPLKRLSEEERAAFQTKIEAVSSKVGFDGGLG